MSINIPIEVWLMIIDHLKKDARLDIKEKILEEKEQTLNDQNDQLNKIIDMLNGNLIETENLINNISQIENKLTNTLKSVNEFLNIDSEEVTANEV